MPTLLDASDGRRAAAHTVVEHRVALVGVGENEIAQQINGLLGGVNGLPTVGTHKLDTLLRIADAWIIVASTRSVFFVVVYRVGFRRVSNLT